MRLDLFHKGDKVLLLGEGNFSFGRNLFSHNLPIDLTITCYHNGIKHLNECENVEYLLKHKVPIYYGIDATKLHENEKLKGQIFSKIIFNFPHVGGKMKLQLNRELVKNICKSAHHLLMDGGLLIISLCNGQGGTAYDKPQRKWSDSWQVVEMAAHGNFCLIDVEPFIFNNFPSYKCTGYRSQDLHFNLRNALVHIFKKKAVFSRIMSDEAALERLSLVPIKPNSNICVPYYYSQLYSCSPLYNPNSAVSFFNRLLLNSSEAFSVIGNLHLRVLDDNDIPLYVESEIGVRCSVNGSNKYRLRSSVSQVLIETVENHKQLSMNGEVSFFPGMYFNFSLGNDFLKLPPVSINFLLVGNCVSSYFFEFINYVVSLFHKPDVIINNKLLCPLHDQHCAVTKHIPSCKAVVERYFSTVGENVKHVISHELVFEHKNMEFKACMIYLDKLIEYFFNTSTWKEMWSDANFISYHLDSISVVPFLKCGLLCQSSYKFDITLKYDSNKELSENDVYEILRISALDVIIGVELINVYNSGIGWSSKCFRITYQSFSEPLHREKVIDLHSKVVGKMLSLSLQVCVK